MTKPTNRNPRRPGAAPRRRPARSRSELDAARRVSEALFEHLDSDTLIQQALLTALQVVGAESGSVLLADSGKKALIFRHGEGRSRVAAGTAVPWEKGIAGHVFQTGRPVVLDQVRRDVRHYGEIDAKLEHVTRDMIVLPLKRWRGEPIGVLEVLNKRKGRFDRDDLALLTVVSAVAASSIERAYYYEEAKLAEVVRFLGDVSHDVKNLLVPVTLGAGVLEAHVEDLYKRIPSHGQAQGEPALNGAKAVLQMLRASSRRIQQQLKDIANCVKGLTTPPDFAPCRLASVVADVFATLKWTADEHGIALIARGVEDLPDIEADAHRLFNALYNLIGNAIDAMSEGGAVTVAGERRSAEPAVTLSVIDTGPGLAPDVAAHLFTGRIKSTKVRGSGLGIKIVKDVVEGHGGRITVKSEKNVGTTFVITLPLRAYPVSR